MAVNYTLTATEIMNLLGYDKPTGKEKLEKFQQENNINIPEALFEFLEVALENPMLEYADIWTDGIHFFYDEIEEMIEEDKDYWEENPDEEEDFSDYYQFYKIPKEDWPTKVANYLLFGSDQGAGVVVFGIKDEDWGKKDPVVYIQHEADFLTVWNPYTKWAPSVDTVSEYLMSILLDALTCIMYQTSKDVLEDEGWAFSVIADDSEIEKVITERGIDADGMKKHLSLYNDDVWYKCCYDDTEQEFFIIKGEKDKRGLLVISKTV